MDFNSAVKTLNYYLNNQSFLQKISSMDELELITANAFCLLLNQKGELFYLPEEKIFKKGIFFFDDDWIDPAKVSEDRYSTSRMIKSSVDLFEHIVNEKIIRSGYWDIFTTLSEIKLDDSILVIRKQKISTCYDMIVLVGPLNETGYTVPEFFSSFNLRKELTYRSVPHTIPPKEEQLLSYRDIDKVMRIRWSINQINTYLGSIWNERLPSTTFSRLSLLFESVVMLAEKNEMFNKTLQVDKDRQTMVGIPSNFIIGVCGGYARGEYSKNSDLDILLIHEGNKKQFLLVGEALHQVLQHVPNLELCKIENLRYLNFHEDSISNILKAFLQGDAGYLDSHLLVELDSMLKSIEQLRQSPLSPEERKNGVSKFCWSIYKSIVNMVPIYEKPIGKGDYLRNKITIATKSSLSDLIPIILRVTDSLSVEKNIFGDNLRSCQPYIWDSVFKKYSVLTALQDASTILAVLNETTFTSSTVDRFKLAKVKNIITEDQYEKFIQSYQLFSQIRYKLTSCLPIEPLELINEEIKGEIRNLYERILQSSEPIETKSQEMTLAYPLLIFSDLHWGINIELANQCLAKIRELCVKHQVRSVLIAGDVLNVDRVNELEKTDTEGISLLNELLQIQNAVGDQRIHIISGNHDPEAFYVRFQDKMIRELDIHYIGESFKDQKIWVEHGDTDFWKHYKPPMKQYISDFRIRKNLTDQVIIVGHTHRIHEKLGFLANGAIGKSFSSIIVTDGSIELIRTPIEYSFDFEKIKADYTDFRNSDVFIDEYIQDNFELVQGNQYTSDLADEMMKKRTWIVIEEGVPTHIIPFNKAEEWSRLNQIQVIEVAFPIYYTFSLGQTLKDAWGVFSISGSTILPVMNQDKEIIGTISIFSVPKPEKEHAKTKDAEISDKMKELGDILTQKLFEQQKKCE